MAIKKSIFIIALLITLSLLTVILIFGNFLNNDRKSSIDEQMQAINQLNELQTYSLMNEVYGGKMACVAFKMQLKEWDKTLWDLGQKIESYRLATEEFQKDQFYLDMKQKFNENEVLYLTFLTKVKKECNISMDIVSYFYQNSEECKQCDDQSFVLTNIKQKYGDSVAIFSFDTDINVTNVDILRQYYEIDKYPCVVINEKKYCGMQDNDFIVNKLCTLNGGCYEENSTRT